jgi:hypothetical protein
MRGEVERFGGSVHSTEEIRELVDLGLTHGITVTSSESRLDVNESSHKFGKDELIEEVRAQCCEDCHESVKSIERTLYRFMETVQGIKSELEIVHKKIDGLTESGVTSHQLLPEQLKPALISIHQSIANLTGSRSILGDVPSENDAIMIAAKNRKKRSLESESMSEHETARKRFKVNGIYELMSMTLATVIKHLLRNFCKSSDTVLKVTKLTNPGSLTSMVNLVKIHSSKGKLLPEPEDRNKLMDLMDGLAEDFKVGDVSSQSVLDRINSCVPNLSFKLRSTFLSILRHVKCVRHTIASRYQSLVDHITVQRGIVGLSTEVSWDVYTTDSGQWYSKKGKESMDRVTSRIHEKICSGGVCSNLHGQDLHKLVRSVQ